MITPRHWRFLLFLSSLLVTMTLALPLVAQVKINAYPHQRITRSINNFQRTTLHGNIPQAVQTAQDLGLVDDNMQLNHMILVLRRSVEQKHALIQLLDEQQNKNHANYHQWIQPEEFGRHFGVADSDISQLTDWLTQQGLTVEQVARGNSFILFSGTAKQVSQAFGTEFHRLSFNGENHISAITEPSVPTALAPVIGGIPTLHDFFKKPYVIKKGSISSLNAASDPQWTVGTSTHYFGAADFAAVYNTTPLLQQGFDGTGVSIGVVGRTDIELSDVQIYRQMFNLKKNDPIFTVVGQDPGMVPGDDGESYLDVEVSGGAAPGAQINFVTSRSSLLSDGVDLSAMYIVVNNLTDIITESYGQCEYSIASSGAHPEYLDYQETLWEQAAAQGITVFVSTGDNGPAACDSANSSYSQYGYAVSGLASTPYNIAVGGTMFSEGTGTYWSATNGTGFASALGYIPEIPWNEAKGSGATGASGLWAGSGGISAYYARPSWQRGSGIPATDPAYPNGFKSRPTTAWTTGPHRLLPDVSLNAATSHDATVYCAEGVCQLDTNGSIVNAGLVGGTSVATPEMAGVQALINHKNGGRQGMTGYIYYSLADAQSLSGCASSSTPLALPAASCAFNDITTGNIMVCGNSSCTTSSKLGWTAAAGYDLATGLGSVNATNLATQWSTVTFNNSITTLSLSQTTGIQHGTNVTFTVQVAPGSGTQVPTGDVAFLTSSGILGDFCTLDNGSCVVDVNNLPGGTYTVWARYGGDANFGSSQSLPIQVTVGSEDSVVNIATYNSSLVNATTFNYGAFVWIDLEVTNSSQTGVATGTLSIYDNGNLLTTVSLNSYGNADLASGPVPSSYSTFLFSNLPLFSVGTHVITVSYPGDGTFNPGTSSPVTITINKVNATLTTRATQTYIRSGASDTLTLTTVGATGGATPTGTVTFTDNTTSTALGTVPVVSGIATLTTTALTTTGGHSIVASYSGDGIYNATNASALTITVGTGTATSVALTSGANPANLAGRPVLTATVTPTATGTVSFWDGSTQLGTGTLSGGKATYTAAYTFPAGTHNITANYQGNSTYAGSSSTALAQVVNKGAPNIQLTVQNTGDSGQNFTFSAALDNMPYSSSTYDVYIPPTGTVQFFDGANPIGAPQSLKVVLSASGGYGIYRAIYSTSTLSEGSHAITAVFSGDSNYLTATSNAQTVGVRITPVISFSTPDPIFYGTALSAVTLNPTATYSGNPVLGNFSYTVDGVAYSASAVLSAGHHTLVAAFTPTDTTTYSSTAKATVDLLVNKATLTVKADDKSMAFGGTVPPLTYAITGYLNSDTSAVVHGTPVLNTTATSISPATTYAITVDVTPMSADNYTFTGSNGTLTINSAASSLNVSASSPEYGQDVVLTASVAMQGSLPNIRTQAKTVKHAALGGPAATGTVVFTVDGSSNPAVTLDASGMATLNVSRLGAGTHTVVADYSGDTNYQQSSGSTSAVVSKAALTVTATNLTMPYGGLVPTLTANITGFKYTDDSSVVSGTPVLHTDASSTSALGPYPITVDVTPLSATNYTFAGVNGTLTVEKASPSLTVAQTVPAGAPVYGQPVTVQGSLTPATATGTLTFTLDGGSPNAVPVSGGTASSSYALLSGGAHQVDVAYSGDTNYNVTSKTLNINVQPYGTAVTLASSSTNTGTGQSVTFTATASHATGGAQPTGNVEFRDGSTVLTTVALNASGVATFSTTSLTVGTHPITAVYAGDTNYAGVTSNLVTQTVVTPDYTLSANPTSITIVQGGSGQSTITATAVGGFNSALTVTCGTLPQYMSCSFAPSSLSWNNGTATATLTMYTTPVANAQSTNGHGISLAVFALAIPGLFFFGSRKQPRKRALAILMFLVCLMMMFGMIGCGGGSSTPKPANQTPKGSYTVPVVITGGTISHTLNLTVTVQ